MLFAQHLTHGLGVGGNQVEQGNGEWGS